MGDMQEALAEFGPRRRSKRRMRNTSICTGSLEAFETPNSWSPRGARSQSPRDQNRVRSKIELTIEGATGRLPSTDSCLAPSLGPRNRIPARAVLGDHAMETIAHVWNLNGLLASAPLIRHRGLPMIKFPLTSALRLGHHSTFLRSCKRLPNELLRFSACSSTSVYDRIAAAFQQAMHV